MTPAGRTFRWFRGAALAAIATLAAEAQAQQPMRPVSDALDQMGRDFCKTFKVNCRKAGKPAQSRTQTSSRKADPAEAEPQAKPVPVPRQKPQPPSSPEMAVATPEEVEAPRPRPKPAQSAASAPVSIVVVTPPATPPAAAPEAPEGEPGAAPQSGNDDGCLADLRKAGARFETVAAPPIEASCRVEAPVRLAAVATAGGSIALPEQPLLNCRFALAFTRWIADAAAPGVVARQDARLAKLATGPGFDCRGRNGDIGSKLSEHATGNAVDVSTLTLSDGKLIQVADAMDDAAPSHQLLRGLRTTACGYFTTVLGPGANAAHASHFHFDLGRHGKSDNYRICE